MSRGESYPGRGYWILKQCGQTINKHRVVVDHSRERVKEGTIVDEVPQVPLESRVCTISTCIIMPLVYILYIRVQHFYLLLDMYRDRATKHSFYSYIM